MAKDYIDNAYQPHSKFSPIQYDPQMGVWYNERPNPFGETESISQAMSSYIFQPLYNR